MFSALSTIFGGLAGTGASDGTSLVDKYAVDASSLATDLPSDVLAESLFSPAFCQAYCQRMQVSRLSLYQHPSQSIPVEARALLEVSDYERLTLRRKAALDALVTASGIIEHSRSDLRSTLSNLAQEFASNAAATPPFSKMLDDRVSARRGVDVCRCCVAVSRLGSTFSPAVRPPHSL